MHMNAESLLNFRRIMKLHEGILKKVCEEYQLTLTEASIICFLKNNPTLDTAGDIVEIRMLSKGNVSQAVESLIQKSLLQRTPDTDDRRKIHLSLLPTALPISNSIDAMQEEFIKELFQGFTEEEYQLYVQLNERFIENTKTALARRKKS